MNIEADVQQVTANMVKNKGRSQDPEAPLDMERVLGVKQSYSLVSGCQKPAFFFLERVINKIQNLVYLWSG